jgi:hypothetical protein
VFIPCLDDGFLVIHDETTDLVELSWAESMIPRKFGRHQPELGVVSISPNVDVDGLVAVETVEKQPVPPRDA